MSGRILLHVGAPKTGSTYLQRRLRSPSLRAQGVHVPVLPIVQAMAGNAKLIATALSSEPSLSFRRAFPAIDHASLDARALVDELLRGWQRDRELLVLSAENFRPGHAPRLRELLPADADIRVVLMVRRQDLWLESYYNQLVKTFDIALDISDFTRVILEQPSDRFCRPAWDEHAASWRDSFGDCRVVLFDRERKDLWTMLFAAAGCKAPQAADIPSQQVSLNLHQLAYLRELDETTAWDTFLRHRRAAAAAARRLPAPPRRSLIEPATRTMLIEAFQSGNEKLAAELGIDGKMELRIPSEGELPVTDLQEVRASADYRRFRALAGGLSRLNRWFRFTPRFGAIQEE